jgi:hypothetical protein
MPDPSHPTPLPVVTETPIERRLLRMVLRFDFYGMRSSSRRFFSPENPRHQRHPAFVRAQLHGHGILVHRRCRTG